MADIEYPQLQHLHERDGALIDQPFALLRHDITREEQRFLQS